MKRRKRELLLALTIEAIDQLYIDLDVVETAIGRDLIASALLRFERQLETILNITDWDELTVALANI